MSQASDPVSGSRALNPVTKCCQHLRTHPSSLTPKAQGLRCTHLGDPGPSTGPSNRFWSRRTFPGGLTSHSTPVPTCPLHPSGYRAHRLLPLLRRPCGTLPGLLDPAECPPATGLLPIDLGLPSRPPTVLKSRACSQSLWGGGGFFHSTLSPLRARTMACSFFCNLKNRLWTMP